MSLKPDIVYGNAGRSRTFGQGCAGRGQERHPAAARPHGQELREHADLLPAPGPAGFGVDDEWCTHLCLLDGTGNVLRTAQCGLPGLHPQKG